MSLLKKVKSGPKLREGEVIVDWTAIGSHGEAAFFKRENQHYHGQSVRFWGPKRLDSGIYPRMYAILKKAKK